MNSPIQSPIEQLEAQVSALDEQIRSLQERATYLRAKLEGMNELAAFSAAHAHGFRVAAIGTTNARAVVVGSSPPQLGTPSNDTINNESSVPKKRRQISDSWKPFFKCASSEGGATMADLEAVAKANNIEYRLLKNQLRYYLNTGLMAKYADKFVVTDAGREVSKIEQAHLQLTQLEDAINELHDRKSHS